MKIHEFKSVSERNAQEVSFRHEIGKNLLPFGVHYLDRVMRGITKSDLVLIGGKSGSGKSELAYTIAENAARNPEKRVHLYCLEAENTEYERRQKYRMIAQKYYASGGIEDLNYLDWVLGDYKFLSELEEEAQKELEKKTNVFTLYRENEFNVSDFKRTFAALNGKSDLVVVDHLHYFDTDDENENRAFTEITKTIRDMALLQNIPVVLVAHLKKISRNDDVLVPDLSDFHGTSNIFKIVTKTITLAPGGINPLTGNPITYFRTAKFRAAGERVSVIGKTEFDTKINTYDKKFQFGVLSPDQKEFLPLTYKPRWLKI